MLGRSKLDPRLLLVARALVSHVEQPARIWRISKAASEAASKSDSIARKRKALLDGTPILAESTFDLAEDSWLCYVAIEVGVKKGRAVAVEILEPYAYDDCGHVVDVNVLRIAPTLPESEIQRWVLDLEDVAGISPIQGTPHDAPA